MVQERKSRGPIDRRRPSVRVERPSLEPVLNSVGVLSQSGPVGVRGTLFRERNCQGLSRSARVTSSWKDQVVVSPFVKTQKTLGTGTQSGVPLSGKLKESVLSPWSVETEVDFLCEKFPCELRGSDPDYNLPPLEGEEGSNL